jgi:hypothetical protein
VSNLLVTAVKLEVNNSIATLPDEYSFDNLLFVTAGPFVITDAPGIEDYAVVSSNKLILGKSALINGADYIMAHLLKE